MYTGDHPPRDQRSDYSCRHQSVVRVRPDAVSVILHLDQIAICLGVSSTYEREIPFYSPPARPQGSLRSSRDRRVFSNHLRSILLTARKRTGSSELRSRSPPMTTPTQPQSKFLTVNGLRLHYLDWGKPGAPPILCIHGYTSSAEAFSGRSEEHTSELQSRLHLVCRLL